MEVVVSPNGCVLPILPRHVTATADPALLNAPRQASRWKRLLDEHLRFAQ